MAGAVLYLKCDTCLDREKYDVVVNKILELLHLAMVYMRMCTVAPSNCRILYFLYIKVRIFS